MNAFVEESVNGQKVIKVFNHEDATQKTFDEKNEELFHASAEANTWGNVTMPVVGNMGYILYILLAIVGGFMALSGMGTFGLVCQIGVYTGWIESGKAVTAFDWIGLVLICFVLPAVLSTIFCELLRKKGWIKEGDLKL